MGWLPLLSLCPLPWLSWRATPGSDRAHWQALGGALVREDFTYWRLTSVGHTGSRHCLTGGWMRGPECGCLDGRRPAQVFVKWLTVEESHSSPSSCQKFLKWQSSEKLMETFSCRSKPINLCLIDWARYHHVKRTHLQNFQILHCKNDGQNNLYIAALFSPNIYGRHKPINSTYFLVKVRHVYILLLL